ncbi:DUF2381 family protein [Archangium violaceum]|uniref:DUF2381 family protein n=1 Tax=Archangium violaceum TaxID=83451 RepID=UPI001EF5CF9B|nr:DUF2381 family protein [Archangium violaceum]
MHRIELTQAPPHDIQEVRISAGLVTTLLFDSRIHPGRIELEAEEDFTVVEASGRLLMLIPSSRLAAGRRLRLSVRFEDGEAPVGATFILVMDPQRAERQVEVFRLRRAPESCQRELDAERARTEQLQAELEHLRTRTHQERNLERMALLKIPNEGGIIVRNLSKSITWNEKAVLAVRLLSYRDMHSKGSLVLQVELTLPRRDQPWRLDKAELSVQAKINKHYTPVWEAFTPSNNGLYLLMESEVPMANPNTLYKLTLTTQGGQQLIIGNIPIP